MDSKRWMKGFLFLSLAVLMTGCIWKQPAPTSVPTSNSTPYATPVDAVINPDRMMNTLQDLTQIQAYSGWRTSATQGEKEALSFVKERLSKMDSLVNKGLEVSQDTFRVFLATEIHQTTLILKGKNGSTTVPVNGIRGARDNVQSALRLDSDGKLNDNELNPVTVSGEVAILRDGSQFSEIDAGSLKGKIVFIEYAWLDTVLIDDALGMQRMQAVIAAEPAGIVLVTTFSNQPGISHGTFAEDLGVISRLESEPSIPTVVMRSEDLPGESGGGWAKLEQQEAAQLTWDTDILTPAESGNLVAMIPGETHEKAVLLSAHIDSANTPGALDDGSGSAILLEIAAAINEAKAVPPMDLYLVWYGSEEIGLLGSANFTAQHEEIIDKLAGMLNIDCLSRPVEGAPATLNFAYGSGSAPGDTNDPWANYLVARAEAAGIPVQQVYLPLASDNSSFAGYNVANLDLIYDSDSMMNDYNGVWFAGHLHDPYDETALVRQVQPQLEQMAQIALDTALIPENVELFRQKSGEQRRVLFISSHNEDVLLTPAALFDLGLAFEHAGMDVDTLPYGQALTASDLENVDLAIALPVFDLPESETPYDESWSDSEINVIKEYVNSGGTLILTNTAHRVKYYNTLYEENEDWADANALGKGFGITYLKPGTNTSNSSETTEDRLTKGVPVIYWYEGNGVPFSMVSGISLATAGGQTVLGRLEYGKGTVIAVADIGMLSAYPNELLNPQLVKNILDYTK